MRTDSRGPTVNIWSVWSDPRSRSARKRWRPHWEKASRLSPALSSHSWCVKAMSAARRVAAWRRKRHDNFFRRHSNERLDSDPGPLLGKGGDWESASTRRGITFSGGGKGSSSTRSRLDRYSPGDPVRTSGKRDLQPESDRSVHLLLSQCEIRKTA